MACGSELKRMGPYYLHTPRTSPSLLEWNRDHEKPGSQESVSAQTRRLARDPANCWVPPLLGIWRVRKSYMHCHSDYETPKHTFSPCCSSRLTSDYQHHSEFDATPLSCPCDTHYGSVPELCLSKSLQVLWESGKVQAEISRSKP